LSGSSYWGRFEASSFLGTGVGSFKESIIWVEESFSFIWWASGTSKICLDLSTCLCSILLQSSLRKIAWVNWKTICLRKEYGGLGVRRLREFNLALLGKWCWRMLVDREGMWFRVLAARYGVEGGRLRVGGRHGSMWWREIASIREGDEGSGGSWFGDHVVRRVGDGSDTLFWTDPWLGETPFRERFGRLFDLAETKQCTVAELSSLGWGIDGEAWVWRRPLRAWEEELLRECQILLSNISLQAQSPDRWQWRLDPDTGYTVRGAYQFLTIIDSVTLDDAAHLIWHPQVPLKVSVLAWRLLRDRSNRHSTYSSHVALLALFGL
ncbi:cysteine-rich receptor-like protein kinase, partial [Trifolium pratense]